LVKEHNNTTHQKMNGTILARATRKV